MEAGVATEEYDEIWLVVTHPVVGQFVARKITDPELLADDAWIDRTVNTLIGKLAREHSWPDCEPTVFCKRIKHE